MSEVLYIGSNPIEVLDVVAVAHGRPAMLAPEAAAGLDAGAASLAVAPERDVVDRLARWLGADGEVLPRAFVTSHLCSVGAPLTERELRATVVVRAASLAQGASGVRADVVRGLLASLDRPWQRSVPRDGSTGVAGCPILAAIGHELWGWGQDPARLPEPTPKEALALLNGSSHATALAALAVDAMTKVLSAAEAAAALTYEAVRADLGALDPGALGWRRPRGPAAVAMRLRALLRGSTLAAAGRAPDAFSVRCAPAVHGAADDGLAFVTQAVQDELGSVSDNPLWFDAQLHHIGHHHAAGVAAAMDAARIWLAQVGTISERRTYRLTYGRLTGLPSFLVPDEGLQSGFMLAQYTAASLVGELRGLSMPASVDSLPSAQHLEDHVPQAARAARLTLEAVDRLADVVAIELICAAQAVDLRMSLGEGRPGVGTGEVFERVRALVPRWDRDRVLHTDLVAMGAAVRAGTVSA